MRRSRRLFVVRRRRLHHHRTPLHLTPPTLPTPPTRLRQAAPVHLLRLDHAHPLENLPASPVRLPAAAPTLLLLPLLRSPLTHKLLLSCTLIEWLDCNRQQAVKFPVKFPVICRELLRLLGLVIMSNLGQMQPVQPFQMQPVQPFQEQTAAAVSDLLPGAEVTRLTGLLPTGTGDHLP